MDRFTTRNVLASKGLRQSRQPDRDLPTSVSSVSTADGQRQHLAVAKFPTELAIFVESEEPTDDPAS